MSKQIKLSEAPVGSVIRVTGTVISTNCDLVTVETGSEFGPLRLNAKRTAEVIWSPIVVGSRVLIISSGIEGKAVYLDEALDRYLVEIGPEPRQLKLFNKTQLTLA